MVWWLGQGGSGYAEWRKGHLGKRCMDRPTRWENMKVFMKCYLLPEGITRGISTKPQWTVSWPVIVSQPLVGFSSADTMSYGGRDGGYA